MQIYIYVTKEDGTHLCKLGPFDNRTEAWKAAREHQLDNPTLVLNYALHFQR